MTHSLRAKLSGLRYKGILEDKDYKRLCNALDNENVFEQIRAEIDQIDIFMGRFDYPFIPKKLVLYIIDKYKGDKE